MKPKGKKEKVVGFLKKGVKKRCPSCNWIGKPEDKFCEKCGSKLITERGISGYLMSFLIYFGIIFASLSIVFGSFLSLLNTYIGQFIPPYIIILLIALTAGYLLTKKSLMVGVIYCIILVVILGFAFPLISGIPLVLGGGIGIPGGGGIDVSCYLGKFMSGDYQGLEACYTTVEKDEVPTYTGTKSYESLKINFGTKKRDTYVISSISANDTYFFDVSILNSNSEEKISNIKMEDLKVFKNKNMTATGCISYDSMSNLCPFKTSFDDCSESPCTLNPEEEKRVSADLWVPCRVDAKSLRYLTFSVNATYEQNVTHKKTLGVAASYDDIEIFESDANLKKDIYETEAPSDGPVDLLIDFDSPYYLGKRTDNKLKMYVWIENKGKGKLKQLDDIVIEPIGMFPDWLELENGKCKMDG
ncbi:MAG: zinc ribbon domain-containing protein, partial [Methanosarcinales archaeon]